MATTNRKTKSPKPTPLEIQLAGGWGPKAFVAIDFETANRDRSSACTIGVIRVEDTMIVERAGNSDCR